MYRQFRLIIILFYTLVFSFTLYSDTLSFEINTKSRKIMADGFLFEWKNYSSKNWGKSKDNFFDIAFTSEGWCGYITFLPRNDKWDFFVSDSISKYSFSFCQDSLHTDPQIKAAFSKDKMGRVIIEWILLSRKREKEEHNKIIFWGLSSKGDSLPFILTTYLPMREQPKINYFSLFWVLTIFGVVIVFISIIKRPISETRRGE